MHSWNRWGTAWPRFEAMESRAKIIAILEPAPVAGASPLVPTQTVLLRHLILVIIE